MGPTFTHSDAGMKDKDEGRERSEAVDLLTRRLPITALLVYRFVFSGEVVNR